MPRLGRLQSPLCCHQEDAIVIDLNCVPPSTTAQMKRVHVVHGKPVFFHGAKMQRETQTWAALLAPHVPKEPMDGPLRLYVRLTYPHLKATKDKTQLIPKVTRPDLDGAAKHLIDQLVRQRFVTDDARIGKLTLLKLHGPTPGIWIAIAPWPQL